MKSSLKVKTLIVLVDDNRDYLSMTKQFIEMKGYPVMTFSDPYEALGFVMEGLERPAIFLVDYEMGKDAYTGNQLIKHINNIKTQVVVSFLVTAHEDHKLFTEALESDALGYFSKLPHKGGAEFSLGDFYIKHIERAERLIQKELMLAERFDALTGIYGVYDREGGRQKFRHAWKVARKTKTAISSIFVDVNGLGSVNEKYGPEYGYAPGDKVILALAKGLQAHRSSDIVVRIGGDEFLIILPSTQRSQAHKTLARLRKELSSVDAEILPGITFRLTVSGGVYSILHKDLGVEPDLVYWRIIEATSRSERRDKKSVKKQREKKSQQSL